MNENKIELLEIETSAASSSRNQLMRFYKQMCPENPGGVEIKIRKIELLARVIQFLPHGDPHFADSPYSSEVPPTWFLTDMMGENVTKEEALQASHLSLRIMRNDGLIPEHIKTRVLRYWYD